MTWIFDTFCEAQNRGDGYLLASAITPSPSRLNPTQLRDFVHSSSVRDIQTDARYAIVYNADLSLPKAEANAWLDVFVAFYKAVSELLHVEERAAQQGRPKDAAWSKVYDLWREVNNALIAGYNKGAFAAWTVPCLYVSGKFLRKFAIRADEQASRTKGSVSFNAGLQDDVVDGLERNEKLEDAARQINRVFSLCISDRASIEESRKWGIYYIINLLFKTYFKLNSISLSKNILRSLRASSAGMPALAAFPKSHIVTFQYYVGVIHFLEEDYEKAEEHLTDAYKLCHAQAHKNRSLILTYLIPCRLLTSHRLPTPALLQPYPHLRSLFAPLMSAIKKGNLLAFDKALAAGQDEFVKRRIYLTLERGRDLLLRNLFRKVFLAGGFDEPVENGKGGDASAQRVRRTRIPITEFMAALRVGLGIDTADAQGVERDEVECLIANMIYKNLMKGYISREYSKVVLSKAGAFPGTGI